MSQVAGGFGVVARQNAQAAGGDGQRFVETKFGREISDRDFGAIRGALAAPGLFLRSSKFEIVQHPRTRRSKSAILQMHAQFVVGDFVQNGGGVVIKILPARGDSS